MFVSDSGEKHSDHAGDAQKLDLRESVTPIHQPEPVITEEKLEGDFTAVMSSAPPTTPSPSLAFAPLLAAYDKTVHVNNIEKRDDEGLLWYGLEKKGRRKWKEEISPGEKQTEQADVDGG